jgi:hypothetical protein
MEATDHNLGWCPDCNAFSTGCVEPDAEGYPCEACEGREVVGAEQALLLGWINVDYAELEAM